MEERRNQRSQGRQQQGQSETGRSPQQAQQTSQQSQREAGRAAQAQNITGESNLGQQGGMGASRQQQQFQPSGGQQSGGSGAEGNLAQQIREHMDVVDQGGAHIGTVDHIEGDRIKLTRSSSGTGEHQYVPLSEVAGVERDCVRLRYRGDTTFGMEGGR